jgi:hypothetical protein
MSVFKTLTAYILFMNSASLAIIVTPHARTHTHTLTNFFVLTQSQIWRKSQTVTVPFSLDATIVSTRWTITEVSHFPIIIQYVLKVGSGTTRWPGQFLTVVGFKTQRLKSTLGPLETIKIELFGNPKIGFWERKKLSNSLCWTVKLLNTGYTSRERMFQTHFGPKCF